jgi:hypothetical protein
LRLLCCSHCTKPNNGGQLQAWTTTSRTITEPGCLPSTGRQTSRLSGSKRTRVRFFGQVYSYRLACSAALPIGRKKTCCSLHDGQDFVMVAAMLYILLAPVPPNRTAMVLACLANHSPNRGAMRPCFPSRLLPGDALGLRATFPRLVGL